MQYGAAAAAALEAGFQHQAALGWPKCDTEDLRKLLSSLRRKLKAAGFTAELDYLLPRRGSFSIDVIPA